MTDTPVPEAAVQIAADVLGRVPHLGTQAAYDVVAALKRAGWLRDPAGAADIADQGER